MVRIALFMLLALPCIADAAPRGSRRSQTRLNNAAAKNLRSQARLNNAAARNLNRNRGVFVDVNVGRRVFVGFDRFGRRVFVPR